MIYIQTLLYTLLCRSELRHALSDTDAIATMVSAVRYLC